MRKQWRVLLLLKRSMLDMYRAHDASRVQRESGGVAAHILAQAQWGQGMGNLEDRHKVHEETVRLCKDVLDYRNNIQWTCLMREELSAPIRDVDLVVTVGGDGTLLNAGHYLDDSTPVLGVNSDPTRLTEAEKRPHGMSLQSVSSRAFRAVKVQEKLEEYDATRSTGYLCGATADTFDQVLDEIVEQRREPLELTRISTRVNGIVVGIPALNDVLLAHPNPAAVSRCTFSLRRAGKVVSGPVHSRSSGIRICTAAGSTGAMQSAGGQPMALQSPDLQYMVREPILPHPQNGVHTVGGWVRRDETLELRWGCRRGALYFDGSRVVQEIGFGSQVEFSAGAPPLKVFSRRDRCS